MPDEIYLPKFKFYISGFSKSPFGIEWMGFEENRPIHPLVQKVSHISFEVQDIELKLEKYDLKMIIEVKQPAKGIYVTLIEHNGEYP